MPTARRGNSSLCSCLDPPTKGRPYYFSTRAAAEGRFLLTLPQRKGSSSSAVRQVICGPTNPCLGSLSHRSAREFHPVSWAACLVAGEQGQASFGFLSPCGECTWGRAQDRPARCSLDAGHVLSQPRGLWVLLGPAFVGQACDFQHSWRGEGTLRVSLKEPAHQDEFKT